MSSRRQKFTTEKKIKKPSYMAIGSPKITNQRGNGYYENTTTRHNFEAFQLEDRNKLPTPNFTTHDMEIPRGYIVEEKKKPKSKNKYRFKK